MQLTKLKTTVISDTHGYHDKIIINPTDVLIHAGDSTNYKDSYRNEQEFRPFVKWFATREAKYKVLIAGNHDSCLLTKYWKDAVKEAGIIYLEHEYYEIEGRKIFGSPYTPTYGNWNFMVSREKLSKYWEALEEGIDVLITHGPPKGILDIAEKFDRNIEFCGDGALMKAVNRVKPKFHLFGHIHDNHGIKNNGFRIINDTTFINASMVEDGKFGDKINHPINIYI
jgi:Icc-related predicted phosphoesterase